MKKVLFVLFLSFVLCFAQETGDIGKIALSIIIPDNIQELNATQKQRLEAKITQITAAAGLAASGYDQSFVIYPKFAVNSADVVETGMQDLHKITAEISFYIKQAATNMVFASTSKQVVGTGKTRSDALSNAISKLPNKDAELTKFIEEGKGKIISYYESKCGDIISKANALVKRQEYEEAIYELLAVPEECSSCYAKVSVKAVEAFNAYQDKMCDEQMQNAKTKFAAKDYNAALDILAEINPGASCFSKSQDMIMLIINQKCDEQMQIARARAGGNDFFGALQALESVNPIANCFREAQTLLTLISAKVEEAQKRDWDLKMQIYADAKAREERDFQERAEARKSNDEIRKIDAAKTKEIAVKHASKIGDTLSRFKITF
jgi:hypothetical protein